METRPLHKLKTVAKVDDEPKKKNTTDYDSGE